MYSVGAKRLFSGRNVVLVGGKRTPVGCFMGGLSDLTAPQLGTTAVKGALESTGIDPKEIEEVYLGQVIQAGSGQAPTRQVALASGMKEDTPCTTINKVCASGMKTVMMSAQAIALGQRDTMIVGGMESMSKLPHYLYMRKPTVYGHHNALDSIMSDGLTDVYNNILMGKCCEKFVAELGITREA